MRADIPSPAGVKAPVMLIPTVTSGSSIFSTKSWQASRSRAALYARNAESISSATVIAPSIGRGFILPPVRNLLVFDMNPPVQGFSRCLLGFNLHFTGQLNPIPVGKADLSPLLEHPRY